MMDHNNINDDAHNKKIHDTPLGTPIDTSSHNAPLDDDATQTTDQDFFSGNQSDIKTDIKQQSRSLLVIILIIGFTAILGLLIFSYIYDLAGMRTFATQYEIKQTNSDKKLANKHELPIDNHNNHADDSLNASAQVKKSNKDTQQKTSDNQSTDLSLDDAKETQEIQMPSENSFVLKPDSLFIDTSDKKIAYEVKIAELHENFKHISNQFLLLNQKLIQSEPYLDILIDIRSELKSQKIVLPTLTEYAAAGFPTDMIIVTDAMKLLKKRSIIAARNHHSDTFWSFIKNFAIITSQSNTQGLTGVYRKIGKALDDGDFNNVERLIGESPEATQKSLRELYILVSDKKAIYAEIKLLNDMIIDNAFKQTQNNSVD